MPFPSPAIYPSAFLFPGGSESPEFTAGSLMALGSLVLNIIESDGTVWAVEEFEGWEGGPESTLELSGRARGHGSTGSEPFYGDRSLVISGTVRARPGLLSYAEDRLNAAVSLAPFLLTVSERGRVRSMVVQRQDVVMFKSRKGSSMLADFSVQLVAKDPLKYGDMVVKSTLLPSIKGGAKYPFTYPLTYTGVATPGTVRIINTGNMAAPVWLRVDGPIPAGGWTVTHQGQKKALTFAPGLTLGPGEFVTVDMEDREVLAQGQAARNGYVTSRGWFSLDPGINDIAFSAQTYSPTAQLTVLTKPAWS